MKQRFSRQSKIKWWDQRKIKNTNVMVVGVGGLGNWTALQLAMVGVRKIVLVDMDKVEESNLNRQLFYETDIGKPKVDALAGKLKQINSKLKVDAFAVPVQGLPEQEFQNIHFVFDCLDNIETREHLAERCWKLKIPFMHSACSDVIGETQLVVPNRTLRLRKYPKEMREADDRKSCADFDPAVCTTNMVVASLQVDKFLDYLIRKDLSKPLTNYIRGQGITYG